MFVLHPLAYHVMLVAPELKTMILGNVFYIIGRAGYRKETLLSTYFQKFCACIEFEPKILTNVR